MLIRSSDHFYPRSPILSEKLRASWDSHRHAIKIMSYRICTTNCKRLSRDWSYQSQPRTWSSSSNSFCCLFPLDAGHMVYIYISINSLTQSNNIRKCSKCEPRSVMDENGEQRSQHLIWFDEIIQRHRVALTLCETRPATICLEGVIMWIVCWWWWFCRSCAFRTVAQRETTAQLSRVCWGSTSAV